MAFEHWDKLLWGVERGECVLFLGPELPWESPDGTRRVPAQLLAERLAAGVDGAGAAAGGDPPDLGRVAQRLLAQEDEVGLEMGLARWYEALREERCTLRDDLAALPFRLVVTSAHDPLLETALRRAGKLPAVERYHYRGANKELLPEPRVEAPVLFHLYGHPAEPRSTVLAETQLLDFLTALIAKNPPLPNDLNATLTNGRLFLFLGFGLDRWYLRILLHVLKVLRRGSRSFAVETAGRHREGAPDDAILFYRDNFKVDVQQTDAAEFVAELRRRYTPPAAAGDAAAAPGAQPAAAPAPASAGRKVFLCHAGEDAARAREVHDALARAGLAPWLDKEALRGGDRWDARIEATIREVDFVVVLNSRALAAKSRAASYVNKEIKVALRAEDWRMGSFIIPARIDDAPLLEPLHAYHAVDLTRPEGLRDLVRAIQRQARP